MKYNSEERVAAGPRSHRTFNEFSQSHPSHKYSSDRTLPNLHRGQQLEEGEWSKECYDILQLLCISRVVQGSKKQYLGLVDLNVPANEMTLQLKPASRELMGDFGAKSLSISTTCLLR
jgi:hypothetical protein